MQNVMTIDKATKTKLMQEYARHENDTGSPEVQVAILTKRISYQTYHLRAIGHDDASRRGFLKMVGRRRSLLSYLRRKDFERYVALTDRLNIRRK